MTAQAHRGDHVRSIDGPSTQVGRRGRRSSRARWMASQLGPSGRPAAAARPRARSCSPRRRASWRRWPSEGPLVVVVEDLHWAEQPMLELVEHLLEWVDGVPMLLLATARPEIYDAVPVVGRRTRRNATTIGLRAADGRRDGRAGGRARGARRTVRGPARGAARARRWQPAVRRGVRADAGRHRQDRRRRALTWRGPRHRAGGHRGPPGHPRALPPSWSLHDAAVIGHTFWPGARGGCRRRSSATVVDRNAARPGAPRLPPAVTAVGARRRGRAQLRPRAHPRRGLRADPAGRPGGQARWPPRDGWPRPSPRTQATTRRSSPVTTTEAGPADRVGPRTRPGVSVAEARRRGAVAGTLAAAQNVQPIDPAAAVEHYTLAMTDLVEDDPVRHDPDGLGDALLAQGRRAEAVDIYEQAERAHQQLGETTRAAARRRGARVPCLGSAGGPRRSPRSTAASSSLVGGGGGAELIDAYARRARNDGQRGALRRDAGLRRHGRCPSRGPRTLASRNRGLVNALAARAHARNEMGDPGGQHDERRALALALEDNLTDDALNIYNSSAIRHARASAADASPTTTGRSSSRANGGGWCRRTGC